MTHIFVACSVISKRYMLAGLKERQGFLQMTLQKTWDPCSKL